MASDEALFEAVLGGDLRAFDALYERHARGLHGFIRKQLADPAEADDVLQEAFLALLRDRKGASAARSLKAWLFQISRNLCLNRQRSSRRAAAAIQKQANAPAESGPHLGAALEQRQTQNTVRAAVATLPQELAMLFDLRSQGMSYEDMADVLDVPLGTVKSRMHQMVNHLREELQR